MSATVVQGTLDRLVVKGRFEEARRRVVAWRTALDTPMEFYPMNFNQPMHAAIR